MKLNSRGYRICEVEGCVLGHHAKGCCKSHYKRGFYSIDPDLDRKLKENKR